MTLQHSPRHRAAGPAGFGRSPWPSRPIAVVPSPRPPSERPGWFRGASATTGETPVGVPSIPAPRGSAEGVRASRRPLVRLRPRAAAVERPAEGPAPRHAAPEGLAEVADLVTVTSTPVPPLGSAAAPRRRTGGAIVRLSVVRARPGTATAAAPAGPAGPAPLDPWTRGRAMVVGALAVVVVLTGAAATTLLFTGAFSSRATPPTSPWAQVAPAVVEPAPTVASPIATLSGDGRLLVGADIAAGVYRSAGPVSPDHDCSWSRRGRGTAGETVLASGVPSGPATVTVRPGDAVFLTRGCAPWTRLSP